MFCNQCGHRNPPGSNFCSSCGAALNLTEVEDSSFNSLWTLMHGPCVTIPAFTGPNGMPVGLQLVGAIGSDDATIALAGWIAGQLGALPQALAA